MTSLYVALGAIGYQSKGTNVAEIVIFSLGESPLARFASACILVQALSQCERGARLRRAGSGARRGRGSCLVVALFRPP